MVYIYFHIYPSAVWNLLVEIVVGSTIDSESLLLNKHLYTASEPLIT
jgi:hypothetical protein